MLLFFYAQIIVTDIDDEYEPDAVHSEPTSVEDDVDIIAGVAERCIPYSTGKHRLRVV